MDYTTLSLADVKTGLEAAARDAEATFGALNARQLNWRADAAQWSVAQCFEHLLAANRLMLRAAGDALDDTSARSIWQRLPILPGVLGRALIRSQAPGAIRKYTASPKAQPATTGIAGDVVQRFSAQQRDIAAWLQPLEERRAARAIMASPFVRVVTYSVLDGFRLVLAHDHRHLEQARRVTFSPGFPSDLPLG